MAIIHLVILLVTPLILLIVYVKQRYSYWARQKVPFIEPRFPYGSFYDGRNKAQADISRTQYIQMKDKGPFHGLYFLVQPLITVTDLDLIKTVMIRDFNYFPDRGVYHNEKHDPLSAHLFAIEGNNWRSMRARLTPTFTSGKMKMMFPTLAAAGNVLSAFMVQTVGEGRELEVKEYMSRFTIDVIGSCAFGIECNSFEDPDSEFRKCGKLFFDTPRHSQMIRLFLRLFPEVCQRLGIKSLRDEVSQFFSELVRDTVNYREKNSITRKDFMSLLIELINSDGKMTIDEVAAQAFIFFAAGFETSSSNQTYCLYELALNEECQEKARKCVQGAIEKHGGLTYDAACDMQYLDQCIKETLRLYPSLPVLERKTFRNYQIPNSNVIIPKGMKVHIPAFAIHRDEQYYPNPDLFDPDRFSSEEVAKRHLCAFLPFGEGPRVCIGLRFGMMQSRVGLATILNKFKFSVCPKTTIPLEYAVDSVVLQPKDGLWLQVDPL
ncbi:cytochrome P450 6a2-like [Toxorhynchites rutilus septentrionalis]|uniref:cytochrome P450 6a2-like n=1 Tax=Toxorhynchites rutilus septentrionalis TaxID=329112 RepID=UPI002479512A|nr:cytochrome P450 6a2-like [Toxorhynchites rutilus septentrionalis]